jgi:hypothetical protein
MSISGSRPYDEDESARIARHILAALEAAGFSAELVVADDPDSKVVSSPLTDTID